MGKKIASSSKKQDSKKRKGKSKELQDPNAPAKPTSSYFFFLSIRRKQLKQENPELSNQESVLILGREWASLSEIQKLVFEKLAEADRVRYEKEMEIYNANLHYLSY